jgi:hypothetical protein
MTTRLRRLFGVPTEITIEILAPEDAAQRLREAARARPFRARPRASLRRALSGAIGEAAQRVLATLAQTARAREAARRARIKRREHARIAAIALGTNIAITTASTHRSASRRGWH